MVHSKALSVLHSVLAVNDNTPAVQIRANQHQSEGRSWTPSSKSWCDQHTHLCTSEALKITWLNTVSILHYLQGSIWVLSTHHYIMSLSRKLYFPKSLSFGAIRWSFLALASFIKRNSLRSFHSFSSSCPCASLHKSSSMHVLLRNLPEHKIKCQPLKSTEITLVTRDVQYSEADKLTFHKLWKCLWEIDTASSSDHPQSWKLCLCVFLKWYAAATASRCCSFYHTANSDCRPAKYTEQSHLHMTNNRLFFK